MFKKIKLITTENNDMPNMSPSTVGIKYVYNGKMYGNFLRFNHPTLTVAEVVETTNALLEQMLQSHEYDGEWIETEREWDMPPYYYIDYTCPNCKNREQNKRPYCPECGARMKGVR